MSDKARKKGRGFARLFTGPKAGGRQTWLSGWSGRGEKAEKPLILLVELTRIERATS